MHHSRLTAGLSLTGLTLMSLTACHAFSETVGAGAPHTAATPVNRPGVPEGPAYYTNPEPTSVATDPRPGTVGGAPTTASRPPAASSGAATTTGSSGASAPVLVTYATWNATTASAEVGAFVGGVIESQGTCTLSLERGGRKVTVSTPAEPDATSTSCGALSVPGTQLSRGTWTVRVSYTSPAHHGTAAPTQVDVP